MSEVIDMYAGGKRDQAYRDKVDIQWYFNDLLLSYKYGEKNRFERSLKVLKPYLSDQLYDYFVDLHDQTLWLNPITGKRGY